MKYAIKKQVLWRVVDEEVVIVDPETENYSYLNSTGRDVWLMIDQGYDLDSIVAELCDRYDADGTRVRDDVEALLRDLLEAGIIREARSTDPEST